MTPAPGTASVNASGVQDAEPFGLGDTDGGEGDADTEAQNQEQGRDIAIERTFDRGIGRRERHDK